MLRTAAAKVMWVGRATVFLVGLAVILAVVLGVASAAFGADGGNFKLGRSNLASAVSTLTKSGPGPALSLVVGSGPPLAVNSPQKVANLNADSLDGLDSAQIGVNGLKTVQSFSAENSDSNKKVEAHCPSGKVVVGTGGDILSGKTGSFPNQQTDVVIDQVFPGGTAVFVTAYEETPTSASWSVAAFAVCAKAGTP